MTTLLLHICCGPCATAAIERLRRDYAVTGYFSNCNVATREEYDHRLEAARAVTAHYGVPLVPDTYNHDAWRHHVRGLEDEPEGGRRCRECFRFSLDRAAVYARTHGFDLFTTTLTISPHKDTATLFDVGGRHGDLFLKTDLKEQGGFQRSVELSRMLELYRQSYCGCEFSIR